MRHRKLRGKLSRPTGHRKALLKNLAINLIEHERIRTTDTKAKVLRSYMDKLVTLAKKGTLADRRLAFSLVGKKQSVHKLFTEIGPRFSQRQGGYTRVIKFDFRAGDNAKMSFIEFTERPAAEATSTKA